MSEKKNKGGRPSKYKEEYCEKIIEYFSGDPIEKIDGGLKANPLPFLSNFARSIGVCHDTIIEWGKQHPKFSEAYAHAKELQKQHLIQCGLLGLYNPRFAIFTAKNITSMRDQEEHLHVGDKDRPIEILVFKKDKDGQGNDTSAEVRNDDAPAPKGDV